METVQQEAPIELLNGLERALSRQRKARADFLAAELELKNADKAVHAAKMAIKPKDSV